MKEAINNFCKTCNEASVSAGWWTDPVTGRSTLENPLTVSNKLMLIVSEVAEAMEGDRCNLMDDKLPHRSAIECELADVFIRAGDLAAALKLDVGGAIEEKMAFNKVRPDHKLGARSAANGKKY